MRWRVPEFGGFEYDDDRIRLVNVDDEWLVEWRNTVVHPELDEKGLRLGTVAEAPERAPILDRNGAALVEPRPVVEVGVVPKELEDRKAAVQTIAETTGADAEALEASIEAAEAPTNFVPAITLRQDEFTKVSAELEDVPGIEFGQRELPLAPTKEFGRALLGGVGPVTAEQLEKKEKLEAGDVIGQWGLEAEFEKQLAGEADRRIVVRNAEGVPVQTLAKRSGEEGEPLETTLDLDVQAAAEKALDAEKGKAALVALDAASGDILAAANRPVDDTFDRALEGQYPPGSTFKVVTTAALLDGGLSPRETVDCPPTIDVGGKLFRNFEGGAAGSVPFSVDFAESCNTAFVSLVDRLAPDDLKVWGKEMGLGRDYELAVPAFSGERPAGARRGRAGGVDDRPGPDPRQPAGDGRRRRVGRRRALAPAAPARRRPGEGGGPAAAAARRDPARPDARGRHLGHRHRARRRARRADRQERDRRVRQRRPAANARLVHRRARRARGRGAGRGPPVGRGVRRADRGPVP